MTALPEGKVITARGPVDASVLGKVMMHEHLHAHTFDREKNCIPTEAPISDQWRELLMNDAVPHLKQCNDYGCHAYVDATFPPSRAWPTFSAEVSEAADMHIILCTGFYRDVEFGKYWVTKPEFSIWQFVVESPVETLAEFCIKEIAEGIHGTGVHAGAIKLGTSNPEMTANEKKAFRAGARAQKATGVHITTHCTKIGAETSQLRLLDEESVDLSRVVIGHTAIHLMDPDRRKVCMDWMRRGANFLPTNLGIVREGEQPFACGHSPEHWRPLVDAFHEIFDAGLGDKLCMGLDWGYTSSMPPGFQRCHFLPPPPYLHMFTHTLPAFREMGLTPEEEDAIMVKNPANILPVQ